MSLRGRPLRRGRGLDINQHANSHSSTIPLKTGEGGRRTHIHGRKQKLIARNARNNRPVLARRVDVLGQHAVPRRRRGPEDQASVSGHARRAVPGVVLQPALLDEMLRHCVACAEEDLHRSSALLSVC